MPNVDLPTTWLGLLGLIVLVIGGVLIKRQRGIGSDMTAVRDQVQNNHMDLNLREQIDRMERAVDRTETNTAAALEEIRSKQQDQSKDIRGMREDIGGLRGELRDERVTRAHADAVVDAAVEKIRKQLDRQTKPKPPEGE